MDPRPDASVQAHPPDAPYQSQACKHSHPASLAAVAMLLGLAPPPVQRCRVLELGSGAGTNLLPMADDLRDAELVGIDLSARGVALSQAEAESLRLRNVSFRQMDLMEVTADLGRFDYIIAHCLYSWVSPAVRERILGLCRDHLTDHGLAFISYNTLPGWSFQQVLRDLCQFHAREASAEPGAEVAAAEQALQLVIDGIGPKSALPARMLHAFAREYQGHLGSPAELGAQPLQHDLLAPISQPVYFRDFAAAAERHQLQFVAEANPDFAAFGEVPQAVQEVLLGAVRSAVEMEQYLDFLQMRASRQSVLCRAGREVQRTLSARRLLGVHVASVLRPAAARPDLETPLLERFIGPGEAAVTTSHPVSKAALCVLAQLRPAALEFTDLLPRARALLGQAPQEGDGDGTSEDARELGRLLLRLAGQRAGLIRLRAAASRAVAINPVREADERPMARAVARAQAARGPQVTNFYHETVTLEPMVRWAMQRLDGTRGRAALLEELWQMAAEGKIKIPQAKAGDPRLRGPGEVRAILDQELGECLRTLSEQALLAPALLEV